MNNTKCVYTNFTVTTSLATKVTIFITRKQLWQNYVESWKDIVWNEYNGIDDLKEVADVLLSSDEMNIMSLRKLFCDGHTCMLMHDAMSLLDVPPGTNLLREIVVIDDNKQYVIHHRDIVF